MKTFLPILLLAGCSHLIMAAGATEPLPAADEYVVHLRLPKQLTLSASESESMCQQAMDILKSSNFNSRQPSGPMTNDIPGDEDAYRATIQQGKYLLVSFKQPVTVTTVGGAVTVREIVIGLNRPDYALMLFTIDDESRLVIHGKYSGPLCVRLMQSVKQIVGE